MERGGGKYGEGAGRYGVRGACRYGEKGPGRYGLRTEGGGGGRYGLRGRQVLRGGPMGGDGSIHHHTHKTPILF